MQTYKPMALGLSTRVIEHRRRKGLCITATAYFPFADADHAALWTDASMWAFLAKEMPDGPLIDEGVVKAQPEYLVHGRACPPGGAAPVCAVRARVGAKEKALMVFGDRHWLDAQRMSEPQPFTQMPLHWARAYGGPAFAPNPLGRGHAVEGSAATGLALPNLEHPTDVPRERAQPDTVPAGFGMIDAMWPQRAQHRGTYDDAWFKNHSPGFAPDIDWKHFNLAPPDQWFDAPLVGDEAFAFEHLHPSEPLVAGRLPGIRVRCFLNYRAADGHKLQEAAMALKTVWFFPHAQCGVMLFQGLVSVADEEAADVAHIMVAAERLGAPRPDAHYATALAQRLDASSGHLHALRDADLLPPGLASADPEFDAIQADYKVGDLMAQAQFRNAEVQVERLRQQVSAQGMDPDALNIRMPPREAVPTLEELPAYVEQKMAEAKQALATTLADAAQQKTKADALIKEAGIDPATLVTRGPPAYRASEHLAELSALLAGTPDAAATLAALKPKLAQAEHAAREGYRMSAHLQAPAPPLAGELATALPKQVRRAHAAGRKFIGANLTGANLIGFDLRGADFSGAFMESVDLTGADVRGANFSGAVLAHAQLGALKAEGANFSACNLGRAHVAQANFDHAVFTDAVFMNTALAHTSLRGALLTRANVLEATWGPADWSGCDASDLQFIKCQFNEHVFSGAKLLRANFIECDLSGLDLRGADLSAATFVACKLVGAQLAGATLAHAVMVQGCDLSGADLTGAQMAHINLRGATLRGAKLDGAVLDAADLSEADLTGCSLEAASARGALLMKTRLVGVRARAIGLVDAVLQRADLCGADLSGANLFGSDLSRALADAHTRFDHALVKRARLHPRRELSAPTAP